MIIAGVICMGRFLPPALLRGRLSVDSDSTTGTVADTAASSATDTAASLDSARQDNSAGDPIRARKPQMPQRRRETQLAAHAPFDSRIRKL